MAGGGGGGGGRRRWKGGVREEWEWERGSRIQTISWKGGGTILRFRRLLEWSKSFFFPFFILVLFLICEAYRGIIVL